MAPFRDLDDRDLDRLLAGREVDGDLEAGDLAGLVDDVRATHLRPVAQDTRARHLAAMTEAARLTPSTDPLPSVRARRSLRSLMPRNRFAATAAAVVATTMTVGLGGAGIALAGGDLPDAVSAAYGKIGVDLPNQVTGQERAAQARQNDVREFIAGIPPEERRGCAFGQRVAELASGKDLPDEAKENCAEDEARRAERGKDGEKDKDGESAGAQDRADNADKRDSFGSQTSERAQGQGEATPEQRRAFGPDTAERARDRGANTGDSRRPDGAGRPEAESRPGSAGP
ncbi:MAG: hypothetical protein M3370_03730, partial [Actinomycetota bacterium]|nr:hypothetical protein [Actinomycetota bacterium]